MVLIVPCFIPAVKTEKIETNFDFRYYVVLFVKHRIIHFT